MAGGAVAHPPPIPNRATGIPRWLTLPAPTASPLSAASLFDFCPELQYNMTTRQ
jgi:hypothetical protein